MVALLPRLFSDIDGWLDWDIGLLGGMIRLEDAYTDGTYLLRAELPGIDPDKDIRLRTTNGMLTITAERREDAGASHSEFRHGTLQRAISLPTGADEQHITAVYDRGILTVTVPVTTPPAGGRHIPIAVTT